MQIKRLTDAEFEALYEARSKEIFQDTVSYAIGSVRTEYEISRAESLKQGLQSNDRLHLALYEDDGELAGWSTSSQFRMYSFYTHNSVVFPKFRRRGYYSLMVQETIKYAHEKGYQIIMSNHVAANNDVIIAKLKLGFKIMGVETFDDYGTTVKLIYHLNETRARAYDFRTGLKKPDAEIKKIFGF